jgi:4-hydroxy-4-methyl-2-oxoglutarate aldolase
MTPVAAVYDAMGQRGLLRGVRPIVAGGRAAGPAITALDYSGHNLMLYAALETAQRGDVLICTTQAGASELAVWGASVNESALAAGLSGVVLDAAVRDSTAITASGLPVWARGVTPAAVPAKSKAGWGNVPVVCAGVQVSPGDVVVGDDDGVVAVPHEDAEEVLAAVLARLGRDDAELLPRIERGESLFTIRGYDTALTRDGGSFAGRPWFEGGTP